jgi:outer membrane usher protein
MLRPPFKVRRSRLPALTLLWLLGPSPLPLRAEDDSRLFEVVVNGRTTQLQAEFVQRGERLAALPDDLRALGLQTQGVPTGLDGRIMLDDIPGLKFQLEERTQTLRIKIPDTGLLANQISASPSKVTMSTAASDFGLVTNYNVLATRAQGRTLASGLLDERFNTPWGIIGRAGWLLQTGSPTRTLARLDTSLALTEPDSLRRWQVGDIITAGLSWTRPYRIGGLQVTSDFAPRPDLVTYPIPVVSGRADVPSTVDLFVNSVRQASQPVDQGPFQIRQPPVLTGANDVAVVVRDVTGQQHVQTVSFYVSPALMAPGLASYSLEAGWLREDYALKTDRYTQAAGSATARYGVFNYLTAEAHVEVSGRVAMGGAGATINILNLAVGTLSFAVSNPMHGVRGGPAGGQVSAGIERTGRLFSVSVSTTRATRAFQDVPSNQQNRVPAAIDRASVGLSLEGLGALHLSYVGIQGRGVLPVASSGVYANQTGLNARILSISYTRPIAHNVQFYANAYHDFTHGGAGTGMTFGIAIPLGNRTVVTAEAGLSGGRPSAAVDAGEAAVDPGDIGWRARLSRDPSSRQDGQATYVAPFATATGEVERVSGHTGLRVGATGAVVAVPDGVFASNRIDDSYAVVDTDGVGDIGVLQENRPAGRTNSSGLLLLPNLRGWEPNRIALVPLDLPGDVVAGALSQNVRIPAGSGQHVSFNLHRGESALLHLADSAGKSIPAGSVATLGTATMPVGHDGAVFVTELKASNRLEVQTLRGRCAVTFTFKPHPGALPDLGTLTCVTTEGST